MRFVALALLPLAAACGNSDAWPSDQAIAAAAPTTQTASAQAMRQAASALSLASSEVTLENSPWARAVQCAAAIEAASELVRSSPLATQAQYQQIVGAGRAFAARAGTLAAGEGHSPQDAADSLTEARAAAAEAPQQALRTTLSCIRAQASSGAGVGAGGAATPVSVPAE